MAEPKFEWRITDLSETEIRGTDDVPIIVSRPYWSLMEMKYPNFTAVIQSGKKKLSHTFYSDDIAATLEVINAGGEEKEISRTLLTNVVYAERLMKHCTKLAARIRKAERKTTNKKVTNKSVSNQKVKVKTNQKVKETVNLKVNLNNDLNIKLNNWV